MMNFPEIDLKDKNIRVVIFILMLLMMFFNNFETKTLLSILVVFVVINQYSITKKNITENIVYNYNKSGLINFTKALASKYTKNGIRSNVVCPGGVRNKSDKFQNSYFFHIFMRLNHSYYLLIECCKYLFMMKFFKVIVQH